MMSPPTSPALSAGVSGASTQSKVTPLSAVSKPLTPTNDFGGLGMLTIRLPGLNGPTIAVNAAAPTKNTSKPTKIQVIPLMRRRRFFGTTLAADLALAIICGCVLSNRTVSLYSAKPSPNLNPQLRQKRSSAGMVEWQFKQVIDVIGSEFSKLFDIGHPPFMV